MQYGTAEKSSPSGRMVVLRMGNLNNGEISFKDVVYTSNESDIKKYRLLPGDLLFNRTNSSEKVGGTAIYRGQQPAIFAGYLIRIAPLLVDREFLNIVMNSSYEREFCQRNKHDAVHQSNISAATIATFPIPLPPLAEQRRIVLRLKKLEALCDEIDSEANSLTTLSTQAKARILDLAIRGALVPQDPADEPASALLSRIRTTADKPPCPKREKNAGALGISSSPFPIPESWEWTTLGEVCDYGKCETVDAATVAGETWSLDLEDIEKGSGRLISRVRASERPASGTRHSFRAGHVLYSKLRTYLNKVLVADEDGVCSSEILPLDFRGLVQPGYARFVLMSSMFLDYAARCGYGVKMPRLGTADGRNGPFPLPPLAEQRRIVEKVEELFSAIDAMVTT